MVSIETIILLPWEFFILPENIVHTHYYQSAHKLSLKAITIMVMWKAKCAREMIFERFHTKIYIPHFSSLIEWMFINMQKRYVSLAVVAYMIIIIIIIQMKMMAARTRQNRKSRGGIVISNQTKEGNIQWDTGKHNQQPQQQLQVKSSIDWTAETTYYHLPNNHISKRVSFI